jgi:hypothetical protein
LYKIGISLIKMENNSGLKAAPCGTPAEIIHALEQF